MFVVDGEKSSIRSMTKFVIKPKLMINYFLLLRKQKFVKI